jgi:hypothetical protein
MGVSRAHHKTTRGRAMAKSQKKSSREIRKPKAEKPPKQNASQPSQKAGTVRGLENIKNS